MRFLLGLLLRGAILSGAAAPLAAATLSHDGLSISVPAPRGYKDVTAKWDAPSYVALFETIAVEPLERIQEFNDSASVLLTNYGEVDASVRASQFNEMFRQVYTMAKAYTEGRVYEPPKSNKNAEWLKGLVARTRAREARSITATQNDADAKSFFLETKLVMPGVTTIPVVQEVSMVMTEDAVLTIIVTRADTTGKMGRSVKRTGAQMRRAILRAAKAR